MRLSLISLVTLFFACLVGCEKSAPKQEPAPTSAPKAELGPECTAYFAQLDKVCEVPSQKKNILCSAVRATKGAFLDDIKESKEKGEKKCKAARQKLERYSRSQGIPVLSNSPP